MPVDEDHERGCAGHRERGCTCWRLEGCKGGVRGHGDGAVIKVKGRWGGGVGRWRNGGLEVKRPGW